LLAAGLNLPPPPGWVPLCLENWRKKRRMGLMNKLGLDDSVVFGGGLIGWIMVKTRLRAQMNTKSMCCVEICMRGVRRGGVRAGQGKTR